MKKFSTLITLIVLFGLAVLLVSPVHAADAPTITITSYTVSPSVLMPDSLGTITVVLENTAGSASVIEKSGKLSADDYTVVKTTDMTVNIDNVHLEGNGVAVLTKDYDKIGNLGPGQSLPVTFSFKAPSANGLYYPEVWIEAKGASSSKYPIPVNVNTALGIQKTAILILDSTLTGSQNPGDEIPVMVTVKNSGEMLASDVTLKLENASSTMVAPKNTDLFNLGTIPAGEKKTANVILLSDKKMSAGLVKVPVTIQYSAIDGTVMTQTTSIDILFLGKAELGFVSVDTNPTRLTQDTPFDLTVRIENTGTGEAKQVSAKVDLPAEGTKENSEKPGLDFYLSTSKEKIWAGLRIISCTRNIQRSPALATS
ncbi:MAG: hypothetical protein M0R30_08480, partial [Methanoregula sp.]|uniref:COG1361 S-layer family protein n=1 Tax=Methanoregula sp. TaxID=2052170 RepID=UPI0025F7A000